MPISPDLIWAFDIQGFLHLRGAMTPQEVAEYSLWMNAVESTDIAALNADNPDDIKYHLNRPLSRVLDADPRFACFLDHPAVAPLLEEFVGEDYRHIDNDLYYTYPDYPGGVWHGGVQTHRSGHVVGGRFICPMVKVFYCLTDVGPGEGEFALVPGSHRTQFAIDLGHMDLPVQHVFDDVKAGDVIVFNEALLHNGRPNLSHKTRKTIIINFGRASAGPWPGYAPHARTLEAVSPRQRAILTPGAPVWMEPDLTGVA